MSGRSGADVAFRAKVKEMKDGIAAMLEPHELPGSGGVITVALLELGIERHLCICSTEKSVRALFEGLLKNVSEGTRE